MRPTDVIGQSLVVRTAVAIDAPVSKVWTVLTDLRFVAQWDDAPDERSGETLTAGSVLLWRRVDGGYTRLTVTLFDPPRSLRLSLYGSSWDRPPEAYDVGYRYSLSAREQGTLLDVEIGDFAQLPRGRDFYDAAREFAERAARRIQELAEDGS